MRFGAANRSDLIATANFENEATKRLDLDLAQSSFGADKNEFRVTSGLAVHAAALRGCVALCAILTVSVVGNSASPGAEKLAGASRCKGAAA